MDKLGNLENMSMNDDQNKATYSYSIREYKNS